jgi:adenosylhomocysteine nucleosidase
MTSTAITTAILSALAEEQYGLIEHLQKPSQVRHAGRDFWVGNLHGQPVVLALSKIGKVAAATTATALIERFGAKRMVFTGVAGGLGHGVNVGDVVVGQSLVQHDLDVSPLFPRYEVPLYGKARFDVDAALTAALFEASRTALADPKLRSAYPNAQVHAGVIASGDRFVSGVSESSALRDALLAAGHDVLAVEMEGAAVAQVCHDYEIPFAVVRTISDRADDTAHVDFPGFIDQVASKYAQLIVERLLRSL